MLSKYVQELLSRSSDIQFLYGAYNAVLHRDPDEAGRLHFLQRMKKGASRVEVLLNLCQSEEGKKQADHDEWLPLLLNLQKKSKKKSSWFSGLFQGDNVIESGAVESALEVQLPIKRFTPRPFFQITYDNDLYKALESNRNSNTNAGQRTLWFDLTTSMEWTGGVVGIVRAELELAVGLARFSPNVKFSMQIEDGFVEIPRSELHWLLSAENVIEAYMNFFERYSDKKISNNNQESNKAINLVLPKDDNLFFPFKKNDAVVSVGWKDSKKEKYFLKVKNVCPDIYISYLVYDTILANDDTKIFYSEESQAQFLAYFKWITDNCDFIFCGGGNTKKDCYELQTKKGWKPSYSIPLKFGTDIVKTKASHQEEQATLSALGVENSFILCVGTIEPRKNHGTLYRAYLMVLDQLGDKAPQLVLVGRPDGRVNDMLSLVKRHPRLKDKIRIISPTDEQLAILYKRCLFTTLPSLYEGWSLALPESLGQGKLCIAADVPPLKEIGNNITEFVHPFDVKGWADKIVYFTTNSSALKLAEKKIKDNWVNTTWQECAENIFHCTMDYAKNHKPREVAQEIWFDLTTSYMLVPGVISGIIRVELCYAKYLNELYSNVHYFAYSHDQLFEIDKNRLNWLFDNSDIASAYKYFYEFWNNHEKNGHAYRSPFEGVDVAPVDNPARLKKLSDDAIVFLINIDWDLKWTKAIVDLAKQSKNVLVAQFIHDVTPIVVPQLHQEITCEKFEPFFDYCSNEINFLQYGGHTAQIDGITIQKERNWKVPESTYIKLASDFTSDHSNHDNDRACLESLGVNGEYIITVGTIEPRKNHEVLYKAYLKLLEDGKENLPTLIFVGKPGWNSSDFLTLLSADKRVANLIKIITPNDYQLDVLYRNCKFAVLPSYYEGYSLTLNECLSYGKFCLTSDTPPLREVGGNLVDFINPLDAFSWASAIYRYHTEPNALNEKNKVIAEQWKLITWIDSTKSLYESAKNAQNTLFRK